MSKWWHSSPMVKATLSEVEPKRAYLWLSWDCLLYRVGAHPDHVAIAHHCADGLGRVILVNHQAYCEGCQLPIDDGVLGRASFYAHYLDGIKGLWIGRELPK